MCVPYQPRNNKIEKNQGDKGERAQMSAVFKGMQAQIIWPIGVRCRDFPAWSFEHRPKQKARHPADAALWSDSAQKVTYTC